MARLTPCSHCRSFIAPDEARCPFCDRPQRTTGAWSTLLLCIGLTGMGACVTDGEDPMGGMSSAAAESSGSSGETGRPGNSSQGSSTSQDSVGDDSPNDDDDSWGGGVTYAGPDPWDTNGDSWGTTSIGDTDSESSSGTTGDSDTDTDTDTDTDGMGTTGSSSGMGDSDAG